MKREERRFLTSEVIKEIKAEMERSEAIYGDFHSLHEALAVIREEYLELEKEIFWGHRQSDQPFKQIKSEAVQVAAMVIRLAVMMTPPPNVPDFLDEAEQEVD